MTRKNKLLCVLTIVLTVALVVGVSTASAADFGSESDPLVALSYITDIYTPEMLSAFQDKLDTMDESYLDMFDSKLSQFTTQIQDMLSQGGASSSEVFTVVILTKGQKLTCSPGAEILLRSGSAISYGTGTPILSDTTAGTAVNDMGTALELNHMYLVTAQDNGIYAAGDDVQVLVRGTYTVAS